MANDTYRCSLCPPETPPYELAGSASDCVFQLGRGLVQSVSLRLADGTKHEHLREP